MRDFRCDLVRHPDLDRRPRNLPPAEDQGGAGGGRARAERAGVAALAAMFELEKWVLAPSVVVFNLLNDYTATRDIHIQNLTLTS